MNPFQVVRDFERALCDYTGAPYAVTTTSCTMALLLAVAWHLKSEPVRIGPLPTGMAPERMPSWLTTHHQKTREECQPIEIPKRTYVGVPMSIIHAGAWPEFRDEVWAGCYQLKPLPVWDSARWFTAGLYKGAADAIFFSRGNMNELNVVKLARNCAGQMLCVSFHWAKTLGIQQGGAILHDNPEADAWLRRARFDGREAGVAPKDQKDWQLGWHAYMSPETAAAGLVRLSSLPKHNDPLPWGPGTTSDYPDLSEMDIFR